MAVVVASESRHAPRLPEVRLGGEVAGAGLPGHGLHHAANQQSVLTGISQSEASIHLHHAARAARVLGLVTSLPQPLHDGGRQRGLVLHQHRAGMWNCI